ncbi:dipeptidyl-peptidase III [Paragonimus westermani]|uniref:Dipeptidyl peptidase 3 n=1 Tax=Paragonimus westermani TaxID=34504 RepID=A0A5J4NK01_9TREM|nr:dipeptidyl-peptidase III [Paragonimus westermani]
MASMDFYVNVPPPIHYLDATQAFDALSNSEKRYIFSCSQASWVGGLIDLLQTSPESTGIFLLVHKVFSCQTPDNVSEEARRNGFSESEVEAVLSYLAAVCGNLGNYQNFGDTKFIPSVSQNRFAQFLSVTKAFKDERNGVIALFAEISDEIYSLVPRRLRLGFGPNDGISTYYSSNCTRKDAEIAQVYLKAAKLEAYNTRLFKEPTLHEGKQVFSLKFASVNEKTVIVEDVDAIPKDWVLRLQHGDMSELMTVLVEASHMAESDSLNTTESRMWNLYARSFETGDIAVHKEGSKIWVKDKNPVVETYIGFIESYRDPLGVRGEFEGFVAVVNKVISAKFQLLVDSAIQILPQLPWPASYERDQFMRPDFTSLDVVTFATSGIPIGINIPNYDDIRESDGFKNVSLGNVLASRFKDPKAEFLSDVDRTVYLANVATAFEVQVGLHELLGHGSGKLFRRNSDGTFNFDPNNTKDLISGGPVHQWYEPGENWDNKFASLSSPMEECRAECVGVYLCDLPIVLRLFGVDASDTTGDGVPDVVYVNWLNMVRSAVMAMEFYSPPENVGDSGAWRQAHCCARYAILRVLIEADPTMVKLEEVAGSDGAPDLLISLDREKLKTVAKPAIGTFLKKLQYYKSTANVKEGGAFFLNYSELSPDHLVLRKIVIDRKRPRPLFVQPHLRQTEKGEIEMVPYPATYSGLIQSFVDRFNQLPLGRKAISALESVWRKDRAYFRDIPV